MTKGLARPPWDALDDRVLRTLHANGRSAKWIAAFMCCASCTIHRRAGVLGLQFNGRHRWTQEEDAVLRARFPDMKTETLAREIGMRIGQLSQRATVLGLHKSAAYMATDKCGRIQRGHTDPRLMASRFPKGHVPANKGLRRPGWAPGRMRETQFKKGRSPQENANYQPIGTERIEQRDGYLVRKVTDDRALVPARRWVDVHRLVWEAAHGPIPRGRMVRFKEGMKTVERELITLDRLELVTFAENMRRNSIHNLPKPLKDIVQLRGRLVRQIHKHEGKHEKQNRRSA